ncbi:CBS domain-containing protein [Roseomonas sp. NAR14]|uniref:CBS domain-containing protein n=1 Tax=Roseomonas acroporae TaxID=2937791 RepID=A0A9X1Y811_9PROT|nr:CBS domain-containing protein [Roseomonas acroporae]MCK8784810.1 CBS domain-containing protein [Roseomonas acroporae]
MNIAMILKQKGSQVVSIGPGETCAAVVRTLAQHRIGAALVRDAAGAVLGIVSERDVVRALAGRAEATLQMSADDLMTKVLHTVTPQTSVVEALGMMTGRRVRHLPVLEDGKLCGMVSIGDLVKARIEAAEHEAQALREYVTTAG